MQPQPHPQESLAQSSWSRSKAKKKAARKKTAKKAAAKKKAPAKKAAKKTAKKAAKKKPARQLTVAGLRRKVADLERKVADLSGRFEQLTAAPDAEPVDDPYAHWLVGRAVDPYRGQHVAIHPTRGIVAHDTSLAAVIATVRQLGLSAEVAYDFIPEQLVR